MIIIIDFDYLLFFLIKTDETQTEYHGKERPRHQIQEILHERRSRSIHW